MPGYPLTVGGTTYNVDFPYEAYDCQLAMMEKVIESLTGQRNALLESPTGESVDVDDDGGFVSQTHSPPLSNY